MMRRLLVWLGLGAVVALAVVFAANNAGSRVVVDLGIATFDRVPVAFVAFGGMVAGMAVVLAAGLNADLKVRRILRQRGEDQRWKDET